MDHKDNIEADATVYKALLESTNAIPWKIDWKTMQFSYIGPQIEKLLGWSHSSWGNAQDWASRMHPDDSAWVVDFCISKAKAEVDYEMDFRALTKDGGYVWIRDVVHVMHDATGEVDALIGFMFDISERKENELKLERLQQQLQDYSYKDGLTCVANRRMFDMVLEKEWADAQRNSSSLSVIMLDIDSFKQYNDHYGHLKGDECLKTVASLVGSVAGRPRDFFARIGGEEFVLVLPETNKKSALVIAERCRQIILQANIPNEKSLVHNLLTISLGLCTITPNQQDTAIGFMHIVDQALYGAKQLGRNKIVQS